MVNMTIHGCGGAMGQVLSELAAEDGEIQVAAGIDPRGGIKRDYPITKSGPGQAQFRRRTASAGQIFWRKWETH